MTEKLKNLRNLIGGLNGALFALYLWALISLHTIAVYELRSEIIRGICTGFALSLVITALAFNAFKGRKKRLKKEEKAESKKLYPLFFIAPLAVFLCVYCICYPGGFTNDTISQYTQAIQNSYNEWHPVFHTLLAIKLPLFITGGWVGSIVLFQIIALSFALGYALCAVSKYAGGKLAVLIMLFVLINPETLNISMFPWKDVSFSICVLILITYALHIWFSKGEWVKKPFNLIAMIVVLGVATLLRHNAIIFTAFYVFAIMFLINFKRMVILVIGVAVIFAGVKGPLYNYLKVEEPGQRQVEMLGAPLAVIGTVIKENPEKLDKKTAKFAFELSPEEAWQEDFRGDYNVVKWDDRTDNEVIEKYGSEFILKAALRCMKACPKKTLKTVIKITGTSYFVAYPYHYYILDYSAPNAYGLGFDEDSAAFKCMAKYSLYMTNMLPFLFIYVGVMHLALLFAALLKCKLSKLKDWRKILLILPVFAYNFSTALMLSRAEDCTRFFYYTFLITPLLLIAILKDNGELKMEN